MTFDEICRRAGGRRRYNKQRHDEMVCRQFQVMYLMHRDGLPYGLSILPVGVQARWARELGVSRSTISRDVRSWLKDGAYTPLQWAKRTAARIEGDGSMASLRDEPPSIILTDKDVQALL